MSETPNARNRFRDVVFQATQQLEAANLRMITLSIRKELDRQLNVDLREFPKTETAARLHDQNDTTKKLACDLCGDLFYRRDPDDDEDEDDEDEEDQNRAKNTLEPYPDRQHEQVVAACSPCRERLSKLGRRDAPAAEPNPTPAAVPSIGLPSEPSSESIQEAYDYLSIRELAEFAGNLDLARDMYRRYPKLVGAPRFPENLRKAFIQVNECEPGVCETSGVPRITSKRRKELLTEASELARRRMLKEQGYTPDDLAALKSMGISA